MRVLIAEDEVKTALHIRKALAAEGFAVDVVHTGTEAITVGLRSGFDAIVLDIMMPGPDGLAVLRQLRAQRVATPVLLLSARGRMNERVDGLEAGADDYLAKPFALAELVARVRALGRRSPLQMPLELCVADLVIETSSKAVRRGKRIIRLAAREYLLLEFLMRVPGRVCSRATILESVWEVSFEPSAGLLDVYIKRLRDKLSVGSEPQLLHTVRGVGYLIGENS